MKEKAKLFKCVQCGDTWYPRKAVVKMCPNPKCHSMYWDDPTHVTVKRDRKNKEGC